MSGKRSGLVDLRRWRNGSPRPPGHAGGALGGQAKWRLSVLGLLLAVPTLAVLRPNGQSFRDLPTAAVSLSDWGVSEPSQVRLGRVSLIHEPKGGRLDVRLLRERPPREAGAPVHRAVPSFDGHSLMVADFASGTRNRLGGYFASFQRAPSQAEVFVVRATDDRRALRLAYRKEAEGFSGLWLHFFDYTQVPSERRYLDARGFSALSFWVRGSRGGGEVALKLADAEWEEREDALALGYLRDFLPTRRVTPEWQQVVVPLGDLPHRLDLSLLASLVLEAVDEGAGEVDLTGVAFSLTADSLAPLPEPAAPLGPVETQKLATWVWNTAELLDDPAGAEELFRFLAAAGIDRVRLQLPGPTAEAARDPRVIERLRPLLAALHRHGIEAYALDGAPVYALAPHHAGVLQTIAEVIRYNARVRPEERFQGIHYDIEPYLLPGFHGPRRESILHSYLELIAESARQARDAGLVYGVDIPFWYDVLGEHSRETVTVEFGGVRKPASEHVIDLVDEVTLMAYRTVAYGADGVIRHSEGELAYAADRGKRVVIGLETHALPDEELIDFAGPPSPGLPERPPASGWIVLAPVGDSTRVWYMAPAPIGVQERRSNLLGHWLRRQGVEHQAARWWAARSPVRVPGDKLSFQRLGQERLSRVIARTAAELGAYPSFSGFAIHHAASYRTLLETGQP